MCSPGKCVAKRRQPVEKHPGPCSEHIFSKSCLTKCSKEVHLWVQDPGSTTVVALQYYDEQLPDTQAPLYTTDDSTNPEHGVSNFHTYGIIAGAIGGLGLLIGLFWKGEKTY